MPGVVPDEGELRMLATIVGTVPAEDLALRLYTNDKTPALADRAADYVEMTEHGYVAKVLVPTDWGLTPADAGTNTPARAMATDQAFLFGAPGSAVNVYGYFIVGLTSGMLMGAERFSDGPYRVANSGDQITITPVLRLRTEYP